MEVDKRSDTESGIRIGKLQSEVLDKYWYPDVKRSTFLIKHESESLFNLENTFDWEFYANPETNILTFVYSYYFIEDEIAINFF
ncbi:MAG: hypothetical protein O9264_13075 [Leptospira sp.]|nr:hypothetical protein [Leptospira sp.]